MNLLLMPISFLEKENIVNDKQYGFRVGCSTTDPILRLVDKCANNLDRKLFTIAVFLVFDTVNRGILVRKMERLALRGVILNWFVSYLTCRKMYVDISGSKASVRHVDIGLKRAQ